MAIPAADLVQVLHQTLSGDRVQLQRAQEWLEQACRANAGTYLFELAKVLHTINNDPAVRTAAGLQLKNFFSARDIAVRKDKFAAWARIDTQNRALIKQNVLETLGTEHAGSHAAPSIIAALAIGEIPAEEWPELVPFLCDGIIAETSSQERRLACLESIGYICEDVDGAFLLRDANRILTGIIFGIQSHHPPRMRLAATRALMHALDFCKGNFDNEQERNYIMQIVCGATQIPTESPFAGDDDSMQVRVAALQCLSRIITLYYQHMEVYMKQALCAISYDAMQSDAQDIALQGIEFWSTVAEEERDLKNAARENALEGRATEERNYHFVNAALTLICPLLLQALTRQSDAEDDDEWTVAKAATVCLMFLAQAAGDDIVGHVIPFAGTNVANTNWRYRDAAATAVGSILEGPDAVQLRETIKSALPYILKLMRDENALVRDSSAWTMARICDHVKEAVLTPEHFGEVVQVLLDNLQVTATGKVAAHTCYTLASLVEASYNYAVETTTNPHRNNNETNREENAATGASGGDAGDRDLAAVPPTFPISYRYAECVQQLLNTANRPDSNQSNLRVAAYEALTEIVDHCAQDCTETVFNTCLDLLKQVSQLVVQQEQQHQQAIAAGSLVMSAEMAQRGDLLQLVLPVVNACLRRLPAAQCEQFRVNCVDLMFRIFDLASTPVGAGAGNTAHHLNCEPEAFVILSTMVMKLQNSFQPHLPKLGEYLAWAIGGTNSTEHALSGAACALLSDICKSVLGPTIHAAVPRLMQSLASVIERAGSDPSGAVARINAISCMGDIALLLNIEFGVYVADTFALLEKCLQDASEGPYLGGGSRSAGAGAGAGAGAAAAGAEGGAVVNGGESSAAGGGGGGGGAASMHDWYDQYTELRDSIIECLDTVVEALRSFSANEPLASTHAFHPQAATWLRPQVNGIMTAVQKCYLDGELISEVAVRHSAGLIANLTLIFGNDLMPFLQTDFVIGLLNRGKKTRTFSLATKAVCSMAVKQIKRLKTKSILSGGAAGGGGHEGGATAAASNAQQQLFGGGINNNNAAALNDAPSQMGNKQPPLQQQHHQQSLSANELMLQQQQQQQQMQQQQQQQHSVFGGALAVNNPGASVASTSSGGFR